MEKIKLSKKSRFAKWTKQEKIVLTIITVIFTLYAFVLIYPFIFTFNYSLMDIAGDTFIPYFLPDKLKWENYKIALTVEYNKSALGDMLFNSLWQTLLATGLGMVASSCMAYTTAKYDFKFLKVLYAIGIFSMVIPIIGSTPAMYKLLSDLNIRNNPFAIGVIWFNGFGFSFLVLYSFFKTVSWTYAEAAFIDGAGHFRTFIKVMIPQAMPAIWSMLIISAIGFWNDYMTTYLYLDKFPNVALGLFELKSLCGDGSVKGGMPVYYALMLLSLIPIIVVFVAFQKIIMENISTGGLKG